MSQESYFWRDCYPQNPRYFRGLRMLPMRPGLSQLAPQKGIICQMISQDRINQDNPRRYFSAEINHMSCHLGNTRAGKISSGFGLPQ
jgi:hypothetical protein